MTTWLLCEIFKFGDVTTRAPWRENIVESYKFIYTFYVKTFSFMFWFIALCRVKQYWKVRFQVLTATSMKMAVFWVVAQCSLIEVYRRR
jgi:hypothetical protein